MWSLSELLSKISPLEPNFIDLELDHNSRHGHESCLIGLSLLDQFSEVFPVNDMLKQYL